MNAWSHLPNAKHIDRVLASVKSQPKLWDQVWDQAWGQAWGHARGEARSALLALVAYDDCAKYLNLPIDQLQMLYHLTEHPACLLLQPAVVAFAMEKELA